jgi:hypothetical protein
VVQAATFSASFNYSEDTCLIGNAGGTATLTASGAQIVGGLGSNGSPVTSVTFTTGFQWHRVGATADIEFLPSATLWITAGTMTVVVDVTTQPLDAVTGIGTGSLLFAGIPPAPLIPPGCLGGTPGAITGPAAGVSSELLIDE